MTAAALGMVAVTVGWLLLADHLPTLVLLVVGIGLGGASFWGMALLLKIEEARAVPRMVLARVRR